MSVVAGQAKEQLQTVVGQAKGELKTQVDQRTQQAASGLKTFASQLTALTQGRPEEAGHVATFLGDAQQRVQSYAQTLEQRGPQALLDDISSFARRKPGMFLAAATFTGFAVGRLVRAGAAASHDESSAQQSGDQGYGYQGYSATGELYGTPLSTPPMTPPLYTDPVPYEGYAEPAFSDPGLTNLDLGSDERPKRAYQ